MNKILIFDVSNVRRKYDRLLWIKSNQGYLEWRAHQRFFYSLAGGCPTKIKNVKQLSEFD